MNKLIIESCKKKLRKGEIEDSLNILDEVFRLDINDPKSAKFRKYEAEFSQISSKYYHCRSEERLGKITAEYYSVCIAKISLAILELCNDIVDNEKLILSKTPSKITSLASGTKEGDKSAQSNKLIIEIVMDKEFNQFTDSDQEKLLSAISSLMQLERGELKFLKKIEGSVRIRVQVPKNKWKKLASIINSKDLADFKITHVDILDYDPLEKAIGKRTNLMIEKDEIIEVLKGCEDLKLLSEGEILTIISIGEVKRFGEGEVIFSMNHYGDRIYFVLKGELKIQFKDESIKRLKSRDLVGEIAFLGKGVRTGTLSVTKDSILLSIDRKTFFDTDKVSDKLSIKILSALSQKALSYVDNIPLSSLEIISKGENDFLEFIESIQTISINSIIETIAGFLNSNGGDIFIGIRAKDNKVIGVDASFKETDNFIRRISFEVRKKLGFKALSKINFLVETIEGKKVIKIECESSIEPIFYKPSDKDLVKFETLIIRSGKHNSKIIRKKAIIDAVKKDL